MVDSANPTRDAVLPSAEDKVLEGYFIEAALAETARDERLASSGLSLSESEAAQPVQEIPQNTHSLTDMVQQMAMRMVVELPLLNDPDADTLVFM